MKIDSAKIILLHPGKTGGTSIEHTLRDIYLPGMKLIAKECNRDIMFGLDKEYNCYLQHADLRLYDILKIPYKEYKTLCTVRRPYERLLSCYYYNGKSKHFDFPTFIKKELPRMFDTVSKSRYSVSHFSPQVNYAKGIDHIIKLENFTNDCKKAGIEVKYHYSKTVGMKKHDNPMDMYDQEMKDIVYDLYKEDFETLGYEK